MYREREREREREKEKRRGELPEYFSLRWEKFNFAIYMTSLLVHKKFIKIVNRGEGDMRDGKTNR